MVGQRGRAPLTGDGARTRSDVLLRRGFDRDGLPGLRAAVAEHRAELGLDERRIDHLLIIVSELASNAVRHAGGGGELILGRTGDSVTCTVADHGPGIARPGSYGRALPDAEAFHGRGLWLVRRLADELVIRTGRHGSRVTARLRVGG